MRKNVVLVLVKTEPGQCGLQLQAEQQFCSSNMLTKPGHEHFTLHSVMGSNVTEICGQNTLLHLLFLTLPTPFHTFDLNPHFLFSILFKDA